MGSYMGSIGMWYKDGIFYELENRHINFFLKHPGILGFSEEEKQKLCESNGLPADAIYCDESDPARNMILLEVLKRGAVRIRFYRDRTVVQCGSKENCENLVELKKCLLSGWGKCFGNFVQIMDCNGWYDLVNNKGKGLQLKDFIENEISVNEYKYISYNELSA